MGPHLSQNKYEKETADKSDAEQADVSSELWVQVGYRYRLAKQFRWRPTIRVTDICV